MTEQQKKVQQAKDAVTVGQIRQRLMATLDKQIAEMATMIKEDGYHRRGEINKFLNEVIGRTLTQLQNLDAMASTEVLFPEQPK